MKQLRAEKVNWPLWEAYYVERDIWCPLMLFSKQELLEYYSIDLLNILDTKWKYESPVVPSNQLYIVFNEDETTT